MDGEGLDGGWEGWEGGSFWGARLDGEIRAGMWCGVWCGVVDGMGWEVPVVAVKVGRVCVHVGGWRTCAMVLLVRTYMCDGSTAVCMYLRRR